MKDKNGTHYDDDRVNSSYNKKTGSGVVGQQWNTPYCHGCGNPFAKCCCDDESGDRDF